MADLKIFARTIEPEAMAQIEQMAAAPVAEGSKIRIMPDCHAGKGCTIGTTMTIHDRVCPNLVGVDIACGVMLARTNISFEERLEELDAAIRKRVPCGRAVHAYRYPVYTELEKMYCWGDLRQDTKDLAMRSAGTLGGGNHFIEAYAGGALCVHTGSRNIGFSVANYYQDIAAHKSKQRGRPDLSQIEPQQREAKLKEWKTALKAAGPDDLAYLDGEDLEHYLHDCAILNAFARTNRETIILNILDELGGFLLECHDTIHNYIDTTAGVLRKGAVSAKAGEKLTIPLNMRDGILVCIGKGNEDWNCSAPHGAGRLYSRKQARRKFSLEQYEASMAGIYTTCVNFDTMDEAPFAYKDMEEIISCIQPTVTIEGRLVPVYNFKAGN